MVITFLVLLAALMLVGTPIFIALAGSVAVAMGAFSHIPLAIVAERLFAGLDKFPLMAIPFFILTGSLMSAGGYRSGSFAWPTCWWGVLPAAWG